MTQSESPKPLRNLTGAAISFGVATLLFLFTTTIGAKLALNPVHGSDLAIRIGGLVRTALFSVATGATLVFTIVGLGLVLLTISQLVQKSD